MDGEDAKYKRVIEWVKQGLASGELKQGDRLPSEKKLSEKFGLSRQTIRHATGDLVNQKLLTRIQGSGTYIGNAYIPPRTEKYMNIAVLSTYGDSYIFPTTLRGIEKVIAKAGYTVQVSFTDDRVHHEMHILQKLLAQDNVDGIIFEPVKSGIPNPNIPLYKELQKRNIPMICFNAAYPDLNVPCVRIDDREYAYKMTRVLIENGHKDIALITKADDGQGKLRYSGYIDALNEKSLSIDARHILWFDSLGCLEMDRFPDYLISRLKGTSACLCYNDDVAYSLIKILTSHGINVPEDYSVVGIDDSEIAILGSVAISSIPHPKEELGEKAASNLLAMIKNPDFDGNFLFHADPILRDSVKNVTVHTPLPQPCEKC
ncbi:MAG: GntR family transcriptional regulator [Catonella sp.]|nr:GntR family transcriptional regulator [Catonella sp.]